jgi:exosome complex exonuclease DIS3/RRP44
VLVRDGGDEVKGMRVVASIEKWGRYSRLPVGRIKGVIGNIGEIETETQALLSTFGIRHEEFTADVMSELPEDGEGYKITKVDGDKRLDYRTHVVCSVDPPGCQDIDDALSCRVLSDGTWEVGVHIADVGHYVKAGSKMDEEASVRSTSTYLVNRRLDMLPKLLTTDLCSLRGGVDRYAFSVVAKVTEGGEVVGMDFRKSVIRSRAALTYEQAQNMIDDDMDQSEGERGNKGGEGKTFGGFFPHIYKCLFWRDTKV